VTEQIVSVPISNLRPCPTNPRKHGLLKGIEEMTASVQSVGILQPVVARRVGSAPSGESFYEVVFGHRRREAARRAELADVPCIVREYSDDQVLEAQIVENLGREDVHPLDEADGFAELLKRGYTVAHAAARVGKPTAYVAQRLKLCALSKSARKALDEDRVTLGVALELAKLPNQTLQDDALERVAAGESKRGRDFDADPRGLLTVQQARHVIESDVMRKLANAPFDTTDASLVPKAGACAACPKRTGAQAELFPDASSPDLCTDPECFRGKLDARWDAIKATAKKEGKAVLPVAEAKSAFSEYNTRFYHAKLEALDSTTWSAGGRQVPVRDLFKKDALPEITIARNPHTGDIIELVPKGAVDKARSKEDRARGASSGGRSKSKSSGAAAKADAKEKAAAERARAKAATNVEINSRSVLAISHAVEKAGSKADVFVLDLVLGDLWNNGDYDVIEGIAARRGLGVGAGKAGKRDHMPDVAKVRREPKASDASWLRGLLTELLLGQHVEFAYGEDKSKIEKACKTWGIDRKAIEQSVVSWQVAEKVRLATEAKAGKGGKAKKSKPGTCRMCGCTDEEACEGGCSWVEPDLCSACAPKEQAPAKGPRAKKKASKAPKKKGARK
jgi:ParB/RepB/Spo0J family partition protein